MSQIDPTISFLSSPGSHLSGLVYLLFGLLACSKYDASIARSPDAEHDVSIKSRAEDRHSSKRDTEPPSSASKPPSAPGLPLPLEVDGFHTAVHVVPAGVSPKTPKPVAVVLHGNYDRPEWQCDTWRHVAGFYGWVVCPRGVPTPWAEKSADRWMYRGSKKTLQEIDAALSALKKRYPGQVDESRSILVGFSLGAILAPSIVFNSPGRYSVLFLIEGGVDKIERRHLGALKKAGISAIGLAMSSPRYRKAATKLMPKLEKLGFRTVYVNMAGAGHDYHPDFPITGRDALRKLLDR